MDQSLLLFCTLHQPRLAIACFNAGRYDQRLCLCASRPGPSSSSLRIRLLRVSYTEMFGSVFCRGSSVVRGNPSHWLSGPRLQRSVILVWKPAVACVALMSAEPDRTLSISASRGRANKQAVPLISASLSLSSFPSSSSHPLFLTPFLLPPFPPICLASPLFPSLLSPSPPHLHHSPSLFGSSTPLSYSSLPRLPPSFSEASRPRRQTNAKEPNAGGGQPPCRDPIERSSPQGGSRREALEWKTELDLGGEAGRRVAAEPAAKQRGELRQRAELPKKASAAGGGIGVTCTQARVRCGARGLGSACGLKVTWLPACAGTCVDTRQAPTTPRAT